MVQLSEVSEHIFNQSHLSACVAIQSIEKVVQVYQNSGCISQIKLRHLLVQDIKIIVKFFEVVGHKLGMFYYCLQVGKNLDYVGL